MRLQAARTGTPKPVKRPATTVTPTGTSVENISSCYLRYIALIETCSTCTKWANYSGTKLVGMAFKLRKIMKNSPLCSPDHLNFGHFGLIAARLTHKKEKTKTKKAK